MANRHGHRRFGNVRKLPSGRWQARYPGPDGRLRAASTTFATKRDAEQFLSVTEVRLMRDEWTDPARGLVPLGEYVERWIAERPGLRPRTIQLYRWLFTKNIERQLGAIPLNKLSTALIREWRAGLLTGGVSQSITAKSYRLLRAVLMTAANEDRLIPRNPCQIKNADKESPEERPTLSVSQVFALADSMPHRRFRMMVLVAAFCSLRWGEITALRRSDVAPDGSGVRIGSQFVELVGKGLVRTPPKSRAGVRSVTVPDAIRADLVAHLASYVGTESDALVFTMPSGVAIRRGSFNPAVKWRDRVTGIGVPHLHFHDLRHTGNTLAAPGSGIRDLMTRMGHDSPRAALIYLHTTSEADRAIADRLSDLVRREQATGDRDEDDDGAAGVLVPTG